MHRPRPINRIRTPVATAATVALVLAVPAAGARGAGHVPHEVIVKFHGQRVGHTVKLPTAVGVGRAASALRRNSDVAYAAPNYIATISAAPVPIPNDTGLLPGAFGSGAATSWTDRQWNFLPWRQSAAGVPTSPGGIDAVDAWQHLRDAGRPGAARIRVAVLDTGIAYRSQGRRFRRSPDFNPRQFMPGYDFVDDDRRPLDQNGHGTHVAGTIAERTNNVIGLTGLAYRAKLMPVRVLNARGRGQADDIAAGIRFAVDHRAQVINMSFNFGCNRQVPGVDEAIRYANRKGVVSVASIGNVGSESCISAPATEPMVIGVGGSTEGGCLGKYSLSGPEVDLLAPGGGLPAPGCSSPAAGPIYQVSFRAGTLREFGIPNGYVGTSMAAAHVSGAAAMVIASGVLGRQRKLAPKRRIARVARRLQQTARSIGVPRRSQGAGLIDLGRATDRTVPAPPIVGLHRNRPS